MRRQEIGESKMTPQAVELLARELGTNASKQLVGARAGGASALPCLLRAAPAAKPRAEDAAAELGVA